MDASEQAAEQIVRMTLAGSEFAIRLTGAASKNVAAGLMAAAAGTEKTKGKARLATMLKSGKELKVFQLDQHDLKRFAEEARRYGVLYTVVKPDEKGAGQLDVMVKAEDASKVNRILEKMGYGRVEDRQAAAVAPAPQANRGAEPEEPQRMEPDHEQANLDALAEILGSPEGKDAEAPPVPLGRAAEHEPRSEPTSASRERSDEATDGKTPDGRDRRSVQRDIEELRRKRRARSAEAAAPKTTERAAAPPAPAVPQSKCKTGPER